jgi:ribosomal protein L11 methyltransferase
MTTVARLICDEPTARRLASFLAETLEPNDCVCAAFEGDDGRWQVAVHFRARPDEAGLRALVAIAAGDAAAAALGIGPLAPADWVKLSLAGLKPVRAGRFLVHGAHDRARVKANDIGIEIEAAQAFGTGHHGTTLGCLLALDKLAKRRRAQRKMTPSLILPLSGGGKNRGKVSLPLKGGGLGWGSANILDIGTGSGVLAIAAAKILNARVVAGDIDRIAVAAARANARLNGTPAIAFVHAAGVRAQTIAARAPYDLIFANILLGPLLRLAVPIRALAAPHARIVLSGLLPSHANAVLAIYRAQGLSLERRIQLDGWTTLVLRRSSSVIPAEPR